VLPLPLPPLLLLLLLPLLLPLELDPARLGLGRLGAGRQPVLRALLADLGVLPRCAEPLVSKKNQVPLLLLEYPLTYLPLTDLRGAAAAPAAGTGQRHRRARWTATWPGWAPARSVKGLGAGSLSYY
jgi:hypothetical protein